MRIAIVRDAAEDSDSPDIRDVLIQAGTVRDALETLGHTVETLPCTLDLQEIQKRIREFQADRVFNLAESIGGQGRLIHLPLFCLDSMGIPYTGASAEAMTVTSNKVMAKNHMNRAGLPTPEWVGPHPKGVPNVSPGVETFGDWIVKSVWEHASIGLDAGGVIRGKSGFEILPMLKDHAPRLGGSCFAERFIDGREFNLSLLTGSEGPEVLPPAEIIFEGYGQDQVKIVDYRAKWDENSYEFHHTPRRFEFQPDDYELLEMLKDLALRCWDVFALSGYARVDFRVDGQGRPWILEINANPCLSPDAGFAAALERAGLPFTEAVRRILEYR